MNQIGCVGAFDEIAAPVEFGDVGRQRRDRGGIKDAWFAIGAKVVVCQHAPFALNFR